MTIKAAALDNGLEIRNHLIGRLKPQMAADVLDGLTAKEKYIPSKYFYDARGSRLFELICRLPEYYLTRLELGILKRYSSTIINGFANADLVELGSGTNWKIRTLLDAMTPATRSTLRYMPVDVSKSAILAASNELARLYPELSILPVIADFTRDLHRVPSDRRRLILLFGSTIGNLDENETRGFLRSLSDCLGPEDRFLLGLDMIKPVEILEAAYNDSQGITAMFNKNILLVLNKQLSGNFDYRDFEHAAFFNEEKERVEMHLTAKRRVTIAFPGVGFTVAVQKGETIRTEICRKFRRERVEKSVQEAGLRVSGWHSDHKDWFSIAEIAAA
jgi:L-histidine Nalpha-methyltransferase